ncbi:hypothetical protein SKAU_G00143770 [Synaphobranchus kaupii]|uniref:Uncharacterized protein n=1 Tax=Synaphobranchus kaupii TaxID=118154 RepID=A0A9Q1FSP8_SYNKA|nr:hypothetical protein SKAU_G00143770 [Synaphobranchus kaupii]
MYDAHPQMMLCIPAGTPSWGSLDAKIQCPLVFNRDEDTTSTPSPSSTNAMRIVLISMRQENINHVEADRLRVFPVVLVTWNFQCRAKYTHASFADHLPFGGVSLTQDVVVLIKVGEKAKKLASPRHPESARFSAETEFLGCFAGKHEAPSFSEKTVSAHGRSGLSLPHSCLPSSLSACLPSTHRPHFLGPYLL